MLFAKLQVLNCLLDYKSYIEFTVLILSIIKLIFVTLASLYAAALQSVFPQTELATFQTLHKRDKERQLLELSMLVTGIRLFNKDAGKGGEGIDDRKLC